MKTSLKIMVIIVLAITTGCEPSAFWKEALLTGLATRQPHYVAPLPPLPRMNNQVILPEYNGND